MSAQNCVSWLFSVCFLCWPVLWMPEEKVKEGEVSTKFYNFLAKQISRKSDYYWRFYSNFLVNTNKANISEKINLKLVGRKSLWRRGGNKFLFCPTKKNFRPIGAFLTILEALSCKTKYRKYLAKYPFPGIHICVTYFQYCNNEPDIPKSSIKQLWNLDPRYTSISPRSGIESYFYNLVCNKRSYIWMFLYYIWILTRILFFRCFKLLFGKVSMTRYFNVLEVLRARNRCGREIEFASP